MKLAGKKFDRPYRDCVVFPRNDQAAVFWAEALIDLDEFEKLVPLPPPTYEIGNDGKKEVVVDDAAMSLYFRQKENFIVLWSLKPSDIEWDKVQYGNPSTWGLWQEELRESYFTASEITQIKVLVYTVNSLSESMLDEAKKDFLAGLEEQAA